MKRSLRPTRDPVKDYFPLPKEIFSLGLSAAEIAIYAYLTGKRLVLARVSQIPRLFL